MLKIILLFIASLLNLALGLFIILKNYKNKINIYYGLILLGAFFWSLGMSLIQVIDNVDILNTVVERIIYIPAFLIPLFYLLFSVHFPYKVKSFFEKILSLYIVASVIFTLLVIMGVINPEIYSLENGVIAQSSNNLDYLIFTIYYLVFVLSSIFILFRKYVSSAGVIRKQLIYIILASSLSFIFALIVSIILPILNNFQFDWLGPLFTLINFFIIGYFVIKNEIDFKLIR